MSTSALTPVPGECISLAQMEVQPYDMHLDPKMQPRKVREYLFLFTPVGFLVLIR